MTTPRRHRYLTRWNRRAAFALALLLAGPVAAQTLPLDSVSGRVVYRGRLRLPGVGKRVVYERAVHYGRLYLLGSPPLLVDSAHYAVSGASIWPGTLLLRFELLLHAEAGGCRYEISDLATAEEVMSTSMLPSAPSYAARHYEAVERVMRRPGSYDKRHQPTPALRAYRLAVARKVDGLLVEVAQWLATP